MGAKASPFRPADSSSCGSTSAHAQNAASAPSYTCALKRGAASSLSVSATGNASTFTSPLIRLTEANTDGFSLTGAFLG